MFHNFVFKEVGGTPHFLKVNPTTLSFNYQERKIRSPMDGIPKVSTQDSTELLCSLIWNSFPLYKNDWYSQIENLVGKSGELIFNKMPTLVGRKNLLLESFRNANLGATLWAGGCLVGASFISDGSMLAPDDISMVYAYRRTNPLTSTGIGCFNYTNKLTWGEHNVFSVYLHEETATQIALNMYNYGTSGSNLSVFSWSNGELVKTSKSATNVSDYGVTYIKNGWYRAWMYIDLKGTPYTIGDRLDLYIYPHNESAADGYTAETTYFWGMQYEQGVTSPTWYCETFGEGTKEQFIIDVLDLQVDYPKTPGTVKHNLVLNCRVRAGWV